MIVGVDDRKTGVAPVMADGPLARRTAGTAVCRDIRGRLSSTQQCLRIVTWSINRVYKSNFHFVGVECLQDKIDIFFVTAGILNFAPPEADFPLHAADEGRLPLRFGRFRNIFRHQVLRVVQQHPIRLARLLIL